jgi:hypothetical protein
MQRSELEHLALLHSCTVTESAQDVYYPALGRTEHTTLLTLMRADRVQVQLTVEHLEVIDTSQVVELLTRKSEVAF